MRGRHREALGSNAKRPKRAKRGPVTVSRGEIIATAAIGFAFGVLFTGTILAAMVV